MTVLIPINTTPAPSRVDTPNFAARADAYHAWLPTAVDAMNAQNTENNALAADVTTKSAAAVVAAAVVTSANPIVNAAAAAASAATASAASSAAAAAALASSNARDAAIAAAAVASAPTEQLSAISQSIHRGTVVKSIIYDTSKDSDGGAWRKRCTDKSWYNETLGGTGWVGQQPSSATARAYLGSLASPELVTNGTFTTDTSGWTSSNATLSSVGGQLQVVGTGGTINPKADTVLTLIVGRTYHVQFEITTASTQGITITGETLDPQTGAGYYYPNAVGTYTVSFVATNATRTLSLVTNSANTSTGSFDNVSVKIADPAVSTVGYVYQSKSDNKFYRLETSGTTEVRRGLTREFPALAAVVVETLRVVIYDLTQASCPMWMVFLGGDLVTGGALSFDQVTGSSANLNSSVAALNASIFIGQSPSGNGQGLRVINFVADTADRISDSTRLNTWRFKGNISRRNNADNGYQYSSAGIVNLTVNDVAVVALDSAPIDPATGLPVPTIALATAGGLSVIRDDGNVQNTQPYNATVVRFDKLSNAIVVGEAGANYRKTLAPSYTSVVQLSGVGGATTSTSFYGGTAAVTKSHVAVKKWADNRLGLLKEDPSNLSKSMLAEVSKDYNSGWQVGDSRLAALADTVAETITASGELVTNGTFTTDTSGWTVNTTDVPTFLSAPVASGGVLTTTSAGGLSTAVVARQTVTGLVVGKTYLLSCLSTATNSKTTSLLFVGGTPVVSPAGGGLTAVQFTASATSHEFVLIATPNTTNGTVFTFDNVNLKLADADRSVKNTGLVINGTLTKAAVASGAGLVAYSGFSASNYLEQPYNSNLDFGTGDFCVMGWVNITGVGSTRFLSRTDKTGATFGTNSSFALMLSSGNWHFQSVAGSWATGVAATTGLHFVVLTFSATSLKLYIDNVLIGSTTLALNITSTGSPVLMLGSGWYNGAIVDAVQGSMALWRISATAPSADQIAHIYRTELPLFQPNAQCTIAGTSTAVTALAYDDSAETLHVGTTWGRTSFKDLLRIDSEATSTGTITSLSASAGSVLTGGTSAKVYVPSKLLRDELAKPSQGDDRPQPYQQFSVKDQQVFLSQAGVKIVGVYIRGVLKKLGIDYTVTSDGFRYIVTTTDKLASRTEVTLLQVKE